LPARICDQILTLASDIFCEQDVKYNYRSDFATGFGSTQEPDANLDANAADRQRTMTAAK
jgi:hypothetical protein